MISPTRQVRQWALTGLLLLSAATPALAGQLTLAWDPNPETNISGYRLAYGTAAGSHPTTIDVGNVTSFTVTGLTGGQTYFFVVYAISTNNVLSPASSEVNGVVPCGSTATGPTSPLAASGGSGSVSVVAGCSWTASDNVPWLTITSGASGSGNGTVSFTVNSNPGTAARFATITVAGLPVTMAQKGDDFGGDGHPDMIWINDTTRQATLWNMGGAQGDALLSWSYLSSAGIPGWTIVGTADFDKDGHPDILWQNDSTRQVVVWYMGGPQGDTMLQWDYLSTNGVPGWTVVGAGDFNNDGHPDIVWQNDSTREATVWYMGGAQGLTLLSWNYLSTVDLPGWRIAAVGDINRDGHPDLVWQNESTRQVTAWYMGGTSGNTMLGWSYISASGVPGWSVVGASDFDADGVVDIVWQNDSTRQVTVWYMGGASGNTLVDWTYLSSAGIPGWKAIVR